MNSSERKRRVREKYFDSKAKWVRRKDAQSGFESCVVQMLNQEKDSEEKKDKLSPRHDWSCTDRDLPDKAVQKKHVDRVSTSPQRMEALDADDVPLNKTVIYSRVLTSRGRREKEISEKNLMERLAAHDYCRSKSVVAVLASGRLL